MDISITQDLFGVAGKTVLVTGGSRGIGSAIAEAFVKAGASVYICSRDWDACQAQAEALRRYGECVAVRCDVTLPDDRTHLASELARQTRVVHILVNNAGSIWVAPLKDYPESGWDKVFDLNVKGCFFLVQQLLPFLEAGGKEDDPARIINVGSISGFHVPAHESYAYSSSKAALHQLTRHLAYQLAERRITVNAIAPGMFPSKMLSESLKRKGLEAVVAPVPLKRLTCPSDLAGAALYLASKAGAYVTGTILPVDGGLATTA